MVRFVFLIKIKQNKPCVVDFGQNNNKTYENIIKTATFLTKFVDFALFCGIITLLYNHDRKDKIRRKRMLGLHRNLLKKLISETLHVKPEDILLDSGLSSTDYLFKTGTFLLDISKLQFTVRQAEKGVYQYQPLKPEQKEVIMKKVNKLQFKNGATHVEVEKGLYVNLLGGFTSSPSSDVAGKAYHEFLKTAYSSTVITSEVLIEKIKEIHNDKNLAAAFADAQFCNQLTNAVVSYTAGEINSLIEEKVPPMKYEEAIAEIKSKTNSAKALITDRKSTRLNSSHS